MSIIGPRYDSKGVPHRHNLDCGHSAHAVRMLCKLLLTTYTLHVHVDLSIVRFGLPSGLKARFGLLTEKSSQCRTAFLSKLHVTPSTHPHRSIIEGINLMQNNQIALHTQPGCNHSSPAPANQRGLSDQLDCGVEAGCTVRETAPNSFGSGFNSAGGGVYATHFDASR